MRPSRRRKSGEEREVPNVPVNWRRLFGYLSPYKLRMAAAIGALAIYSAVGLFFPLVIGQLLGAALPIATKGQAPDFTQLNSIAAALVGLFFVQALFSFIQGYNLTYIGESIVRDLRVNLY